MRLTQFGERGQNQEGCLRAQDARLRHSDFMRQQEATQCLEPKMTKGTHFVF